MKKLNLGYERISLPLSLRNRKRIPVQVVPIQRSSDGYLVQLSAFPFGSQDPSRGTQYLSKRRQAAHWQRRTSRYLLREFLRKWVLYFSVILCFFPPRRLVTIFIYLFSLFRAFNKRTSAGLRKHRRSIIIESNEKWRKLRQNRHLLRR